MNIKTARVSHDRVKWCAFNADAYRGDFSEPLGLGATKLEAIADLKKADRCPPMTSSAPLTFSLTGSLIGAILIAALAIAIFG